MQIHTRKTLFSSSYNKLNKSHPQNPNPNPKTSHLNTPFPSPISFEDCKQESYTASASENSIWLFIDRQSLELFLLPITFASMEMKKVACVVLVIVALFMSSAIAAKAPAPAPAPESSPASESAPGGAAAATKGAAPAPANGAAAVLPTLGSFVGASLLSFFAIYLN
ncbi:Arabinogalactan peptide 23 [Melia azedarach]|uniref:Arabinogalactan peptide 23 n=1 Tax=Melia azedarach TaxID=155640 RepID=A0ACC1YM11_MELAZ|nr:Arabinogalactan peptide 23 [Melia azedarach]